MAESNYHFEARRKERLIERKHEALARLSKGGELGDCTCTSDLKGNTGTKNTQIMYSGPGDFDNNRSNMLQRKQEDSVALEEVVHDPNFKYRFVKACGGEMLHVDPIYRIMYPGALRRVNTKQGYIFLIAPQSIYNWIGTARDRRQYDHSRNGPLLDSTWYSLRKEMMGLGKGTPLYGEGYSLTFEDLQRVKVVTPKK